MDFSNHRRFFLRCLSEDIIPVSIRLRNNIKTPKGHDIINKAEKALLNERIRSINNTINMLKIQVDTCKNHPKNTMDKESMEECNSFIKAKRESRCLKTSEFQKLKFETLCQKYKKTEGGHSNIQHGNHDQNKQKMLQTQNLTPTAQERMKMRKATTTTCGSGIFQVPPLQKHK